MTIALDNFTLAKNSRFHAERIFSLVPYSEDVQINRYFYHLPLVDVPDVPFFSIILHPALSKDYLLIYSAQPRENQGQVGRIRVMAETSTEYPEVGGYYTDEVAPFIRGYPYDDAESDELCHFQYMEHIVTAQQLIFTIQAGTAKDVCIFIQPLN